MTKSYLFIDESGDPFFYANGKRLIIDNEGFQPYLIIGLIETNNRKKLSQEVLSFINEIKADKLYNSIPSISTHKGWYLHARSDHPEIRAKFFELIRGLDGFKAHVVIARKNIEIFNRKHNNNSTEFYFDVLHHLLDAVFKNKVNNNYMIYLSRRGNNSIMHFEKAVKKALKSEKLINYKLEIVPSKEMHELSIVDYLIWAIQRKLIKNESRYYDALLEKYESVIDLYQK